MKKLKPSRPPNPHVRAIVLTVKVNSTEMHELLKRALHLTNGNMSEYLRCAALRYKPIKEDFEK